MTTHPDRVATGQTARCKPVEDIADEGGRGPEKSYSGPSQSPSLPDRRERRAVSTTVRELQVAILECRVAALEQQLETERERRQAVVDRYERLLAER